MFGSLAQLVEHRTGIAEVMASNPVEALVFFSGFFFPIGKFTAMITLHFHLLPQYKSTHWEQGQFIKFIFSRAVK